uniref:Neprosin PEP catalytic domain-containing protein n=1 Tax=Ananas comosus var. bracteatus TaxID=296719 RepID=A0A6V7QAD2_ANACO|nr:unnamed protein product [Ananas comosus var. bracteatus]
MWIASGSYENNDLNTIEVGWQVYPHLHGVAIPRLFISWTRDTYQTTGCYNLCEGFVLLNRSAGIGEMIIPTSTYGDVQYTVTILVTKGLDVNWWLYVHRDNQEWITAGYWPASIFTVLSSSAVKVDWGGEVINNKFESRHTRTQMGSGHFPHKGYTRASYFSSLKVQTDPHSVFVDANPSGIAFQTQSPYCYDIQQSSYDPSAGVSFCFSGPGHNPQCP